MLSFIITKINLILEFGEKTEISAIIQENKGETTTTWKNLGNQKEKNFHS